MLKLISLIVFVILIIKYLDEYYNIEMFNTVYTADDIEQVVVIDKNILFTTISYLDKDPEKIFTIEFITKYHLY